MRNQVFLALVIVTAMLLGGCKGGQKQSRGFDMSASPARHPASLGEKWMGPTRDSDLQISNLANSGLIVRHNLNNGRVQLDRRMWDQLDGRDKRRIREVLQVYQDRNSPKPVTLVFDAAGMESTASAR